MSTGASTRAPSTGAPLPRTRCWPTRCWCTRSCSGVGASNGCILNTSSSQPTVQEQQRRSSTKRSSWTAPGACDLHHAIRSPHWQLSQARLSLTPSHEWARTKVSCPCPRHSWQVLRRVFFTNKWRRKTQSPSKACAGVMRRRNLDSSSRVGFLGFAHESYSCESLRCFRFPLSQGMRWIH